jgi:pilus assembly protein CpaC
MKEITMAYSTLTHAALLAAAIAASGLIPTSPVRAADGSAPVIRLVSSDASSRFVPLGVGKSVVIELPRDVKDVLVADPTTANAVIRSARRAYIIGVKPGQTNVFFFDADGQQIGGLDIAVTRNLNGLRAAIKQALPNSNVQVEGLGDGLVLSGHVSSPLEAQTAFDIAARLVDDGKKVVNNISVHGRDQVMLKVTVAEMQRDIIKQLGIDLNSSGVGSGSAIVNFNTTNPFSALGQQLSNSYFTGTSNKVNATLRAMERAGVIRTLAEPTLTAISGEAATFLVGGEFPIPGNYTCDPNTHLCQIQVQFKKFGVGLNFTPVVLGDGRISLKVLSEVSELSNENSLTLVQGGGNTITVPSIRVRRADTTLEIPSGGSLALAGLIQEQTKQQINGIPGMMQLPILGTLFKSRDYINHQTELAVIVTPYIVRSTKRPSLSRPDDGFADPSDPTTFLLGRLNRIYGTAKKPDTKLSYSGDYGFILD